MFRWTAGTKARADRAARQHGPSCAPGRLLLASRRAPVTERVCEPLPAYKTEGVLSRPPSSAPPLLSTHPHECGKTAGGEAACTAADAETREEPKEDGLSDANLIAADGTRTPLKAAGAVLDVEHISASPLGCQGNKPFNLSNTNAVKYRPTTAPPSPAQHRQQQGHPSVSNVGSSQLTVSPASLLHTERLVRATLAAEQHQAVKRRRGRNDCHQHRHHRRHCGATTEGASGRVFAQGSEQDSCSYEDRDEVGELREAQGSLDSSDTASSLSSDAVSDTYGLLQRQQRRAEAQARQRRWQNRQRGIADSARESATRQRSSHRCHREERPRNSADHLGKAGRNPCAAAAPPAVSVDCVSVQLPLLGGPAVSVTTAQSLTPTATTATTTVTATTSTPNSHPERRRENLGIAPQLPMYATRHATDERRRGGGAAFAVREWTGGVADASETTMVEVAADCCPSGAEAVLLDASLFQEAEVALPFMSDRDVRERFSWGAEQLRQVQVVPSVGHGDFEDHPLGWSPPHQPSAFEDSPCLKAEEEEGLHDTSYWNLPHPSDGQRWSADAAVFPLSQRCFFDVPSSITEANWLLPSPPARATTSAVAQAAPWERPGAWDAWSIGTRGTSDTETSHAPRPSSFPWLPPGPPQRQDGRSVQHYVGCDVQRDDRAGPVQAPAALTSASRPGVSLQAPRNNGEVYPCQPSFLRQHPSSSPSTRQGGPPLTSSAYSLPMDGRGTALPRGGGGGGDGGGQQGRKRLRAPPRALNGTTARCRRFWERCRHPPDVPPPQPF